jgi:hypothetical protein
VNRFKHYGLGFHAGGGLAFAVVIVLLFALCFALLRLVLGPFRRKGGTDESDYWRIHGDGG